METCQVVLRERCAPVPVFARRRTLCFGARATAELGIPPLARAVQLVVGRRFSVLLVVFTGLWLGDGKFEQATNFTVTTTADTNGVCGAACSLREAITAANATTTADTIDFDPSFNVPQTITLGSALPPIAEQLTITGPTAATLTVDANGTGSVFVINSSVMVSISGLTITGGTSSGIINNGTLMLTKVGVTGNSATVYTPLYGGLAGGGGIANKSGAVLQLTESTVANNTTINSPGNWWGGAILNEGTLTVARSTLKGNTSYSGGGIMSFGGTTLTESTVSGNTGGPYGGIYSQVSLTLLNSTVSSNTATGIYNVGTLTAVNSTVTGNTGYGIANFNASTSVKNSIVANNGANCTGALSSDGHNLSSDGTCTFGGSGDLNSTNPQLLPLALNPPGSTDTHALLTGSPGIDAVPVADCTVATDQRGVSRPQGVACDIGAYEVVVPLGCSITVTTTVDGPAGSGSLRSAILCANQTPGANTIVVPAGTYILSIIGANEDANATGDLDITADLTINGAGAATTIIDGAQLDRVFHVLSGTVAISGLTIQNGSQANFGGGIFHQGSALTLTDCTVSGNSVGNGFGGGIFHEGSALTLTNCTVSSNTATPEGGGIYNYHSALTVNSSTVSGNTATRGGGIYNASNLGMTLNSSTVSGNTATGDGGGIFNGGTLTVNSSTVSGNTAGFVGGIYNGPTATLKNTIVANNSPADCGGGGTITSAGHNLSSDATCAFGGTGDLNSTNPLLGPLQNNGGPTETHALLTGSPAIDAVPVADCTVATDQRGVSRPQGVACDIGAYEVVVPLGCSMTVTTTVDGPAGSGSLRSAILCANQTPGADTIVVPAGNYILSIIGANEDANATGDLDITDSLTINGAGAATTIIDGNGAVLSDRVFHILAGTVIISDVTIQNGFASSDGGGGIYSTGNLTLNRSTVSGNSASFSGNGGGGIVNKGTLALNSSTVSSNVIVNGANAGGISNFIGTLIVTNSTISGNTAFGSSKGGGIWNTGGSTLTLNSSTVNDNNSFIGGGIMDEGSATVKNTIVANSTSGGDCSGTITSLGNNLATDNTCPGFTQVTSGQLNLGALQLNTPGTTATHALGSGSVAIDAVADCTTVANATVTTDQRGVARPQGAACDIGAYELAQPSCTPPPAGMVAWWTLDETSGTTANDLALFNNAGTHVSNPAPILGKVDGALSFSGSGDYVEVPDDPEINFGQGDISIDMWVKTFATTPPPALQPLLDKRTASPLQGYHLALFNGNLIFQLADGVGTGFTNYLSTLPVPNDGNWHFVAVTVDRTSAIPNLVLYVDNNPSQSFSPSGRLQSITNPADLRIGARYPIGTELFFDGLMDEIEIFNRALTPPEVQAIYQADSAGKCKCVPLNCDDGIACTNPDVCDPSNPLADPLTGCVITPVDSKCDDGLLCNGAEFCDPLLGCQPGTPLSVPLNDLCANAITVPNGTHLFDTCGATNSPSGNCVVNQDIWYRWVAPSCPGTVTVDTCGSIFNTSLAVYPDCTGLGEVACNDDAPAGSACGNTPQSSVSFNAAANSVYFIRVGALSPNVVGIGQLTISGPYPNPTGCTCPSLTGQTTQVYQFVGSADGFPGAWCLRTPCCFQCEDLYVTGTMNFNTLLDNFVNSVTSKGCGNDLTASDFQNPTNPANPNYGKFMIRAKCGANVPFQLKVGKGPAASCAALTVVLPLSNVIGVPAQYNPYVYEIPLSGVDCNGNGEDDLIDILAGTSLDADGNGIPDECLPPNDIIWNADPLSPDRTSRSLRFRVSPPATATGTPGQEAIKVTMMDLQNPVPPNLAQFPPPNFGAFESATCTAAVESNGCARWVGKPGTFLEAQDVPTGASYRAARLQCSPFYWDWVTETASGPIAVVGAEIAPSSEYSVQSYGTSCKGLEAGCANVSTAVTMYTRRSSDVTSAYNPPAISTQPDVTDVAQVVAKVKNLPGALVKSISQLQPNLVELNADVSALDLVDVVDRAKGFAYAFSGPCPCPSTVTCGPAVGSVACTSPTVCVTAFGAGAQCVKTCTGGTNAGDPCINITHCPSTGGACGAGFCRDRCGRCTP